MNVKRARKKKVTRETELRRLKEKRDDPRWHRLLNEYYELCDVLGKEPRKYVKEFSVDTLAEVIEVLKEKKCQNLDSNVEKRQ